MTPLLLLAVLARLCILLPLIELRLLQQAAAVQQAPLVRQVGARLRLAHRAAILACKQLLALDQALEEAAAGVSGGRQRWRARRKW